MSRETSTNGFSWFLWVIVFDSAMSVEYLGCDRILDHRLFPSSKLTVELTILASILEAGQEGQGQKKKQMN